MDTLSTLLHQEAWIPYNDTFFQSRMVLAYPKNVIFTMQLLSKVQSHPVYQQFPYAERFDASLFQKVDWPRAMIVFDQDHRVVMAPEPILQLIQLDRRLHYKQASRAIFGPFQPLRIYPWIWITGLVLLWMAFFSNQLRYKVYQLVLPSKVSTNSNTRHTGTRIE